MLQVLAGEQFKKAGSDIVRGVDDAVQTGQNRRFLSIPERFEPLT
jgi:hypothetical protein